MSTRRYGATLNGLLSAIDSFARGVDAARSANDALTRKLEAVQDLLEREERQTAHQHDELQRKVDSLEQKLRSQRKAFEEEQRFLTESQDEFLRALLEEHEEQMAGLREQREPLPPMKRQAPSTQTTTPEEEPAEPADLVRSLRRELVALRAEREAARALAQRMRLQRDQAQSALRRLQRSAPEEADTIGHPTTPAPPPFAADGGLRVPQAPRAPLELAQSVPAVASALKRSTNESDRSGPGQGSASG